ncbi:MAG: hypothetical protein HC842_09775, partial [Cytophagales bacterium]|nr:hypothetical protein [Cytophagales bacterium]
GGGVEYIRPNTLALVRVSEKGVAGPATLTVTLTDPDGINSFEASVSVVPYVNPGVEFLVLDVPQYEESKTTFNSPNIYEARVDRATVPQNVPWEDLELTVSASCVSSNCNGYNDYAQFMYRGYVVAPQTGAYEFRMFSDAGGMRLYLSQNTNFANATAIAARPRGYPNNPSFTPVGIISGNGNTIVTSDPINLVAGQVYAYYAFSYRVHKDVGDVLWSGPGLPEGFTLIGGEYSYAIYDTEKPSTPAGLHLINRATDKATLAWSSSADNQGVTGYRLYANGELVAELPSTATSYLLQGLDEATRYSMVVTATDAMSNESLPSSILTFETFGPDLIAPNPVSNLRSEASAGLALQVAWSPATDNETAIFGYNLYVDDELHNTEVIVDTTYIVRVLEPETAYSIKVEAIDGGDNTSEASYTGTTTAFDPLANNLGIKTGKMVVTTEALTKTIGIGINTDYRNGEVMDELHTQLLGQLKPSTLRWGAITANNLSFNSYTGAGKPNNGFTIGKFMERAAEFGAIPNFTCGMNATTDWMTSNTVFNENTFLKFLEYVNGPDTSPGGQLRVAEGYSEPLLNKHEMLIFEFGNEVWGTTHNSPIGSNYDTYAAECRRVANLMRASPYFDANKIKLVYSTRRPALDMSFGLNEKVIRGDNGALDWTGPSGYTSGNLSYDPEIPAGISELEYYNTIWGLAFRYLEGMDKSHAYEIVNRGNKEPMPMYLYESNSTQSTYNGRVGQGVASMDYYLESMSRGAIPVIFNLNQGQWAIVAKEANNTPLALFRAAQLVNHHAVGDLLKTQYESTFKRSVSNEGFSTQVAPVGAFAFMTEAGYSFILTSRDFEEDHYVQLDLPDGVTFGATATMYTLSGEGYSSRFPSLDTVPALPISEGMLVKVPKHSLVMILAEGNPKPLSELSLGHYSYVKLSSVNIVEEELLFNADTLTRTATFTSGPDNALVKDLVWSLRGEANAAYSQSSVASGRRVRLLKPELATADVMLRATAFEDSTIFDEVVLKYMAPEELPTLV